ncbi:G2/mitotic-specific cyclin-B3 isoform X2 [Bemisia tabaci]|uniref:G2/mitotic-specific cyclin-B3 isoform X2 n=1 Tax=Bemisia tabaci TaxID=7038 RepID=UPI0008F98D6D|nr:PREDICTED: G2/mitotic-specific cyclin-B3 isoform X2 [Bemisia tabaci]
MSLLQKENQTTRMPTAGVKKGIMTRSKAGVSKGENFDPNTKRKAEASPPKGRLTKRSAFAKGPTKATGKPGLKETKAVLKDTTNVSHTAAPKNKENKGVPNYLRPTFSTQQKCTNENQFAQPAKKAEAKTRETKEEAKVEDVTKQAGITKASLRSSVGKRLSNMEKSSDASLYESAVESLSDESLTKDIKCKSMEKIEEVPKIKTELAEAVEKKVESAEARLKAEPAKNIGIKEEAKEDYLASRLPKGVNDFDSENLRDPFQVSCYAMDIFEYLKNREERYKCKDYMRNQTSINADMRAVLVDWMVEVQETFELNHETLYLAVKMVDLYLGQVSIKKTLLQLVGATAMFIACKYDERIPPSIEDFHYICAEEYKITDILAMEINMIKTLNFDLGAPLSYRFLRRYSRCAKVQMPLLTLARYILELSLMQYSCIMFSESKLGAAALFLALQMKKISGWTPTLAFYSGYELKDFAHIVLFLNKMLREKPKSNISTIRNKYSHKVFFEVAKTELLRDEDLQL